MRRSGLFFLVLAILAWPSYGVAQQRIPRVTIGRTLPTKLNPVSPDVVTIWQRLGIPQGAERIRAFRDSRINRDGLSPGKERKPPLLRLDHPAFLEEGAPDLLKVAAQMKIDQDLAPQKIKALMYICNIGCSCYNKQTAGLVEKALIEGMKDCSVRVRLAALNVVLSNAGDKCACQGQCQTCCSDGVMKTLEEIAYKQDKRGCYLEPNAQVRSMAEQALNACPPPIREPKKVKEDLTDDGESLSDDGESKENLDDSTGEGPREDNSSIQEGSGDDKTTMNRRRIPAQQVSLPTSYGSAWSNPALTELNIRGVVRSVQPSESQATIQTLRPLDLPVGSQLVLAADENLVSFGVVVRSQTGKATIKVEDFVVAEKLDAQRRIRIGVLDN
ncbi:MAG: hypothetical protein AAF939_15005 [Planctomycetota bacterium]